MAGREGLDGSTREGTCSRRRHPKSTPVPHLRAPTGRPGAASAILPGGPGTGPEGEDHRVDVHGLDCIFKPQRIALWGANENPQRVGSTLLRNLVGAGFRGVVYPLHPKLEAVLGIHCYANVAALPRTPDLAVVCSAAPTVPQIVRECGEAGVRGVVVVSAGFRETGPEGRALEEELQAEARLFVVKSVQLTLPLEKKKAVNEVVLRKVLHISAASDIPPGVILAAVGSST